MRCLLLFGFMLGSCLAFPTIRLQEPKKDQKIMDLTVNIETYGNNYTKHSQVKTRQENTQPQRGQKVRMDNRRVSPTNDVTDLQAKTNETLLNQTKGITTEILSSHLKSLKYFHKRSAEFLDDQYVSEQNDSHPDSSSEDSSDNDDSDSSNDSNNTGLSEISNGAGSSDSSNPTESTNSDSEEFTTNSDSQETTPAASDELNASSFSNGVTAQSESSESDAQNSIFTTPGDISEDSNEVTEELSSESQSSSNSSESNDQTDASKSSSSSDSNSSSESSEPV